MEVKTGPDAVSKAYNGGCQLEGENASQSMLINITDEQQKNIM